MDPAPFSLNLTPHGRLIVTPDPDATDLDAGLAERLQKAFERGSGHGLLLLGADEAGTTLPPVFSYWREFGARYVTALCTQQESDAPQHKARVAPPPDEEMERMALGAAAHVGAEYLTAAVLDFFVARTRHGIRTRVIRIQMRRAGLSEAAESGLEPGRPRAFQSRREPQGLRTRPSPFSRPIRRGCRRRPRRSICRWGRRCASMRARRIRSAFCHCWFRCSERRKTCPVAEGHGRRR